MIVRVAVAGICGSDLHPYFGRERGLDVGTVMGHEFLGEIVEVGAGVRGFSVGDRVFHQKFGYGDIVGIEGDKLDISFDKAGDKKVVAKFVTAATAAGDDVPF